MKPATSFVVIAFLFFELVSITTINFSFCNGSTYVGCIESERESLLKFKQDLVDPSNLLASWTGDGDCCKGWVGVVCDDVTGHIVELRLDGLHLGSPLGGTIADSLGNLTSLKSLDLSYNNLEGRIPKSFGRLCNLTSIKIPHAKLKQDISEVLDIFSGCVSDGLASLDLNSCQIFGHLTDQIGQFKNLGYLNLYNNSISGPIPSSLGYLTSLQFLRLSDNNLEGRIPSSLGNLTSLLFLDLPDNHLEGRIPSSLGNLTSLVSLDLSDNKLSGSLTEIHFANLTTLRYLDVGRNSLILKVRPNWIPPFQLNELGLESCKLGPQFPSWLYTQTRLVHLDLSNCGISGIIANRFWIFLSQVNFVKLSQNQIQGEIPNLREDGKIQLLDLSSNNFSGTLPLVSSLLSELSLFNNSLSGSIHQFLCYESRNLEILNLGSNSLSGEVPDCWMNFSPHLIVMNLGYNKFTGSLPNSMGTLLSLQSLNLQANNFSGSIPVSLHNCRTLVALDLGENKFVGTIPTWNGGICKEMLILNLRSNKFHGPFPRELCSLSSLQILDLVQNNLVGTVPKCISNFSAMVTLSYSKPNFIFYSGYLNFVEEALLVMKGNAVRYNANLNLLRSMDLSENNFSGAIPIEVTDLQALRSLNLSHNNFTGRIPEGIGAMSSIEAVDFSVNQLSGEIPQDFANLTFLSYLNLSTNKLTGKIPSSTQLQSFNESCFMGNRLCGAPLPNCPTPPNDENQGRNGDGDGYEVNWFYVSLVLGFIVGFWSFIGPLIVNRRWRYMYFHFLDRLGDKFGNGVRKYC